MTVHAKLPPQLPRHGPETGRITAEKRLFHELDQIALTLASAEDFGRGAAIDALTATCFFLKGRGFSGQALKPLIDVRKGLQEVVRGVLPELFDPGAAKQAQKRRWSRSSAATEIKVFAAALMDALMRGKSKMKKRDAAGRVARHTERWPRVSVGVITADTVANWRDELLQRMSTDPDRQMFEGYSRSFIEGPRTSAFLKDALRSGPPLTGGLHKPKT